MATPTRISWDQINGVPASLLRLWVGIEAEAQRIIGVANGAEAGYEHGARALLRRWNYLLQATADQRPWEAELARRLHAQLQPAIDLRNGICHGLAGTHAETADAPPVIRWRLKGRACEATWDEIQAHFAWLSKVAGAMGMISHAIERPASGQSLPGRDWWVVEYGLHLDDPASPGSVPG